MSVKCKTCYGHGANYGLVCPTCGGTGSELAPPSCSATLESAVVKINEAEGALILGKIARGKELLAQGKRILEHLLEQPSGSSQNNPVSDDAKRHSLGRSG